MPSFLPLWVLRQPAQAQLLRSTSRALSGEEIVQPATQKLIDDMVNTMYHAHGVGLAAPQIGQGLRLAVIAAEAFDGPTPLVMVNPIITAPSLEQTSLEEGCLSIPKVFGPVKRAARLTLRALDRRGQPFRLTAEGFFARVIQHEVDHLNGRLFLDRADRITQGDKFL